MPISIHCGRSIVVGLACLGLMLPVASAAAATPKRVLVVHSFVNAAPPFTTHSIAFEQELAEKMGEPVDLDEVSLDVARYASLDMEEALVDLMRKRQTKWQPDLVVPIGSPAGMFVARHRDRIFPASTPVIYAGMDRRRLPEGALKQNATFVGEAFDVRGMVDDILEIAPETENIVVVIGASPLEQYWADAFRKEFQPYENRLRFTWVNDLSLGGIVEKTKNLPPRSFIFLILMMRDASGVTHNADEVLQQIHASANAPINSIFQHQLGLGIVGGRLYQAEAEGVAAARIAIRILRGEPASSFPPTIIGPLPPRYDARELEKWNIDETTLPKGSTILFRTPTFWQQHRALILGVVSVCAAQLLLIAALIANLMRRRRAERSLGQSEQRVTLATEAARLGVWELDPATDELWASDKTRELFEIGEKVALHRATICDHVHPEDRDVRETAIDQAIKTRGEYEVEYRIVLKSGAIRWVSGRGRWMADEGDRSGRLIGISMDVTERKEAQELFRLATEASPSGTLLVDDRGLIALVNAHIVELFGYERDEVLGRPIETLLGGKVAEEITADRANFLAILRDRVLEGTDRELCARRKDGSEFPIEVGLNPVRMPRGVLVLMTIVDISPRKRAEEEARRQREQIEALGRASLLGEMTASLAHELGQPLTAILASASAGVRFIDRGDAEPETLREIFDAVGSDGRRARDIIQNVRSTIKTGSSIHGRVDLNQVVETVALMLRPDAAAYACEVHTSLEEGLPLIQADPLQMQQVLINLVTNAFHASSGMPPARRKVEIATIRNGDASIRVTVRDYGVGISKELQERLFEQFYTTKKDGLGMGLPIVRSIVEAHGGVITARNAGVGACFQFELPIGEASDVELRTA
ncbi:PAS domain S-box-containing protein [Roseimicrobium gellanilyticum]|uniref:histidine kinase n=1 Tax=Roseimicrobium gellanilyticum TaxID=748857 RepID=A0A366HXG1_9BACT|nr:PAS domain S-box protein [Roseimicrobium gellanilyticum]RBP48175.1 PAS domain S-box-containing protein [Roseimicrobium gellanilyticum]